jgi:hypothetical protein
MQSRAIATFALLLSGALLAACGRTGDPVPQQQTVAQPKASAPAPTPEPVTDMTDMTDVTHMGDVGPVPLSLEASLAALERGDDVAARTGFQALAQQGDAEARYQLGQMLADGRGGPKSEADAVAWLRKAADQGHENADYLWGAMVLWREPPATAEERSLGLAAIRRAAARNDRNAMAALTLVYANDSQFRDPVEAAYWNDELEKWDVIADVRARNEAAIAAGEQRMAEIDERLRQLDAAERANNAAAVQARGPEPSEADMRAALEYAMYASNGDTEIDNGVASGVLSIKQFQKHGCVPAEGADGYYCEYLIEAALEMQANDGGGVNWNDLLDVMLVPENASGRFVYDTALQRWVRFDE